MRSVHFRIARVSRISEDEVEAGDYSQPITVGDYSPPPFRHVTGALLRRITRCGIGGKPMNAGRNDEKVSEVGWRPT